ncbi:Dot/Icm secretion system substrate [Legionella wadsworthii]|uniref:Dot/Icm secretion system substrate n=1 Tax=Legionella wadsworthii TaxID=28088 RepID=A0A378LXA9_9GAMM|nr:Dot/Icm T4SS effector Wip [Legionella wadsworthii]STY31050.1 Dot/Icm secretion system substrate [Legionella wadsworthii]
MTHRLVNKNIDIYKYPNELEDNLGSITLGDLHGNPIKLIHFLIRHQIVRFKNEVTNREDAYQHFVNIYGQYGEMIQDYLENRTLLQFSQIKIDNAKERITNLEKQLSLITNSELEQYKNLMQWQQQTLEKLKTAEEEQKRLKQKIKEPKEKLILCIKQFNQYMDQLEVCDNQTFIRLLGDEIADRGHCDYFTLRMICLLAKNHCPLNILISNHGSEFIYAFEELISGRSFSPQGYIGDHQIPSFWGLRLLLEHEIISQEELIQLVDESYKPALKIMDYSLTENGITLFSHAPIRFDAIQLMAKKLGVHYDDAKPEALAATIERINYQFQYYIENNTIHSLFHNDAIHDRTHMSEEEKMDWPLIYFFWNRWDEMKETETARPARHHGYGITYVHGHDEYHSPLPHIYNLDTPCGKDSQKNENQLIEKTFRFLLENQKNSIDKKVSEFYLRNVLRYKVLTSDELHLEKKGQTYIQPVKKSKVHELNGSIQKLGLLGTSVTQTLSSASEIKKSGTHFSPREMIIASKEQEEKNLQLIPY